MTGETSNGNGQGEFLNDLEEEAFKQELQASVVGPAFSHALEVLKTAHAKDSVLNEEKLADEGQRFVVRVPGDDLFDFTYDKIELSRKPKYDEESIDKSPIPIERHLIYPVVQGKEGECHFVFIIDFTDDGEIGEFVLNKTEFGKGDGVSCTWDNDGYLASISGLQHETSLYALDFTDTLKKFDFKYQSTRGHKAA